MNIKKLFAVMAATVMMVSSISVNAAYEQSIQDEVDAIPVKFEVTSKPITTYEDYAALGGTTNGWKTDTYDYYEVTWTASDLGTLYVLDDDSYSLTAMTLTSDNTAGNVVLKSGRTNVSTCPASQNGGTAVISAYQTTKLQMMWSCASEDPYPYYGNGTKVNPSISNKFAVALDKSKGGKFETSDFTCVMSYRIGALNDETVYTKTANITVNGGKVLIPAAQDIAIEASAEATTATGYVWNVALTNAAKINEFKATFKATGLEDAVRYIRNIDKVAAAVSGKGSLNFQVGVLTDTTSKTGVTAKFDVKDSDGKTASATVAAK